MKMRMIFLFLAICSASVFIQNARAVMEKDLGTGLSPMFLLDTLRGVAPEVPAGGIGCGLSSSFSLDTLLGVTGNLASGTSEYFTLDTRSSDLAPTPTPTEILTPTPTPTEQAAEVHHWGFY